MNNEVLIDSATIALVLGITPRGVRKKAEREQWLKIERVTKGGSQCFYELMSLPSDIQAKVTLHLVQTGQLTPTPVPVEEAQANQKVARVPHQKPTYNPQELWAWFDSRPESIKAEGYANAKLCQQVRALLDSGIKIGKALDTVAAQNKVARVTLARYWRGTPDKLGAKDVHPSDYAPVLAPRYPGGQEYAELSPEAWEYIKSDWLRPEQPTVAEVYRRAQSIAAEQGWQLPHIATVRNRLNALPWQIRVLAREGEDVFRRKLPYITRTKGHFHALEAVNADGHVFDVRVKLPSGEIGRPVIVAWQDLYSGKILSYRVGETLNQHIVRLSFGDLVENWGIPEHAYLDNGREFANKWLTGQMKHRFRFKIREDDPVGIFTALSLNVHWTTPYHGQSKPLERAWLDLCVNGIAKHPACAGAYTGGSTTTKPSNYGERAIEWEQFLSVVDRAVIEHNARTGRRSETARGRSFDETFAESYSQSTIHKATPEQRCLWLLAAEGVTVGKHGHIRILQNTYWCEALPELSGKKVVVRFDPENLLKPVYVYRLDGLPVGEATVTQAAFDNAGAAKSHTRANNERVKAAKTMLKAERKMDVIEASQMLPNVTPIERERPKVGAIAPLFERAKKVANGYEEGGLQRNEQHSLDLLQFLPRRPKED